LRHRARSRCRPSSEGSSTMRSAAWEAWVAKARSVRIEAECSRRGIEFNGRSGNSERCGPCPSCGGEDRFSINTAKQVFNCRQCEVGGDVITLVQHLDGVDFVHAVETLTGEGPPKSNGKDTEQVKKIVAAEYEYHRADGVLAFVVERIEYQKPVRKNSFRQKRPNPDHPGEWIYNVKGVPPLIYRLRETSEAITNGRTVFVVEGEKCANDLWKLDIPATTNPGGAGKWRPELSKYLAGADVVLIPDNDDAGHKHMQEVGASLSGIASRI